MSSIYKNHASANTSTDNVAAVGNVKKKNIINIQDGQYVEDNVQDISLPHKAQKDETSKIVSKNNLKRIFLKYQRGIKDSKNLIFHGSGSYGISPADSQKLSIDKQQKSRAKIESRYMSLDDMMVSASSSVKSNNLSLFNASNDLGAVEKINFIEKGLALFNKEKYSVLKNILLMYSFFFQEYDFNSDRANRKFHDFKMAALKISQVALKLSIGGMAALGGLAFFSIKPLFNIDLLLLGTSSLSLLSAMWANNSLRIEKDSHSFKKFFCTVIIDKISCEYKASPLKVSSLVQDIHKECQAEGLQNIAKLFNTKSYYSIDIECDKNYAEERKDLISINKLIGK